MLSVKAAIAANRFGLGARPSDVEAVGADPAGWLEDQLDAARKAERAGRRKAGAARPAESAAVLREARELRLVRQIAQRARNAGAQSQPAAPRRAPGADGNEPMPETPAIDRGALREYGTFVRDHYQAQVAARLRRSIETDQPFVERLVHFWSNHFAVSADKQPLGALAGLYEEEAIRPNVTGNFRDLLLSAERHPAMILYLDNQTSTGPRSMAAALARGNRSLGLNENLAREILELHTLGVDGGYDQTDVGELAKVLTGWSLGGALGGRRVAAAGEPGTFHFREVLHEPGDKVVLGRRFKENGIEEGEEVLTMLARHPSTARHLSLKLARHFVADTPPEPLVDRLARTYLDADGELVPVYEALIRAPESWREPLAKYKTPEELVVSGYRALEDMPPPYERMAPLLTQLGQRPFTPGSPAGWPDTAAQWDSGEALLKRIEWTAAVGRAASDGVAPSELAAAVLGEVASEHTHEAIGRAESASQGLALLLSAPEFQRR